ncbi:MAG TPA: hypothetical protein VFZ34_06355 [Blastocatellia bacterium]|nr:hypothetical protein [Blastocatellia bacterium]
MSQRNRIIQYVMGEASETEQQHTEEQYFANAEFLHEIQAVSGELIDAYLNGTMSADEQARFEERLHAIPFLREQFETTRALMRFGQTSAAAVTPRDHVSPAKFSNTRTPRLFWQRLAWVGVAGGFLMGGIWYGRQLIPFRSPEPSPPAVAQAPIPPATVPQSTPQATAAASVPSSVPASPSPTVTALPRRSAVKSSISPIIASLLLSANVVRGENKSAPLLLPSSNGQVRLQLELPSASQKVYQVKLQTAQEQTLRIWRNVKVIPSPQTAIVELHIPAHQLPRGEYFITLTPGTPAPFRFRFSVEPQ